MTALFFKTNLLCHREELIAGGKTPWRHWCGNAAVNVGALISADVITTATLRLHHYARIFTGKQEEALLARQEGMGSLNSLNHRVAQLWWHQDKWCLR